MGNKPRYHLVRETVELLPESKLSRIRGFTVDKIERFKEDIQKLVEAIDHGRFPGDFSQGFALAHHQMFEHHARIFVVRTDIAIAYFDEVQVFVNPSWKRHPEGREVVTREACLSHPFKGTRKVKRWNRIIATFEDPESGDRYERELTGEPAQIFQHETDHTEGRSVWIDKVPR